MARPAESSSTSARPGLTHRPKVTGHSYCDCNQRKAVIYVLLGVTLCVWKEGRKEGNVLFNDALHTFYLRLYGVRHVVKDHSDSESRNPLLPHRLLFPINSKVSFICTD